MSTRWRRFTVLLAVALIGGALAIAAPAGAESESDPFVTELLAGQTEKVGEVQVWNDADFLYVKYVIDAAGWCMTESHLAVATSLAGIPQKNGNPPPGQFPYKANHNPCVTEYTYQVPITWPAGAELFIAAHAVVKYVETSTSTPDLTWQRGTEADPLVDPDVVAFYPGFGGQWTPAQGFTIALNPLQPVWDSGSYWPPDPTVPTTVPAGVEFASWSYAYTTPDGLPNAGYSDLRRFQATFTVPRGCAVTDGMLRTPDFALGIPINDNIYVFVNGQDNLLFWGGTRANVLPDFEGMAGVQALRGGVVGARVPAVTDGWYIPGELPEVTAFVAGANTIDIFTEENERWGGMGKPVLDLGCEYTSYETAWGDGTDFPGRNWATYFNYTIEQVYVCPGIESSVGVDFLSTPPSSVLLNQLVNNTQASVFAEQGPIDVTALPLNDLATGDEDLVEGMVCSYYVHVDQVGDQSWPAHTTWTGSITFTEDILGVIVRGTLQPPGGVWVGPPYTLNTTNPMLGLPGTVYPVDGGPGGLSGLELDPYVATDYLSFTDNTVSFALTIAEVNDRFRVVLDAIGLIPVLP
jgi:hypothetical protein